ncbi:hypothetical protein AB3662_37015 [Sorangium cellulosum]|uniref:hypothetical protein n=1 Tax=Sorangium cellulosum TaxID=56 RepID=UPI003D9A5A22
MLRLPSSWSRLDAVSGRDQLVFRRRAVELLQGLRDAAGLRLVVLATAIDQVLERVLGLHGRVQHLQAPAVRLGTLRDEALWGTYASHARRAAELLGEAPRATPIAARVLVGCLALGVEEASATRALASAAPLRPLLVLLSDRLAQPEHRELAAGLASALVARGKLPLDVAERLASLPAEHQPLLLDCVGYQPEASSLRVTETVRLGWDEQSRHARELFWDRGRALSIDAQLHRLAAEVYRACVERFHDDAYA